MSEECRWYKSPCKCRKRKSKLAKTNSFTIINPPSITICRVPSKCVTSSIKYIVLSKNARTGEFLIFETVFIQYLLNLDTQMFSRYDVTRNNTKNKNRDVGGSFRAYNMGHFQEMFYSFTVINNVPRIL